MLLLCGGEKIESIKNHNLGSFNMKVAIHQPNFLPYLGYFDKMSKIDLWVHYDDAQFVPRDYHHRNRIATPNGPLWLTVPIYKPNYGDPQPISNIKIKGQTWQEYFIQQIERNYKKSKFFDCYFPRLKKILEKSHLTLTELNIDLINLLRECFGIRNEILFSSSLSEEGGITSKSTEKILDLCNIVKADTYLSGSGGRGYLDEELLKEAGINLEYQEFYHPIYRQVNRKSFLKNMSAVDILFNCGNLHGN